MHSISFAHPVIGLPLRNVPDQDLLEMLTSVQGTRSVYPQCAYQLLVDSIGITDNIAVLISLVDLNVRYFCCLVGGRPVPVVATLLLHNDCLNIQ